MDQRLTPELGLLPRNACNFKLIELFFCGISRYATIEEIQNWPVKDSRIEFSNDFKTETLFYNHQALQYDLQFTKNLKEWDEYSKSFSSNGL